MKNIFLVLITLVFSAVSFSQKKGKEKKLVTTAVTLASTSNVIFEMNKKNGYNKLYLLIGVKKDTLLIKSVAESTLIVPANCKLKIFTSGATPLLNVTWIENTITGDAKIKLENATKINNEIWDINTKNQTFSNIQTTTNIKEVVYLDRLKNASETQERNRKEGFEFMLQPNGEILLLNKAITNTMIYNSDEKKYKIKKK